MGELDSDPGKSSLPLEEIELLLSTDGKESLQWLDQTPTFLFFSANWCRPCKNFTSVLADMYKTLKSTDREFQVIFVSLDRDETSFREYSRCMPWLVLPFDLPTSTRLCERYNVSHIPSLILWSSDCNVVEEDVVRFVDDYGIGAFPFTRKRREQLMAMDEALRLGGSLQALLGTAERDYVISGDGMKIPISHLAGKTIGLYFGGYWSPPCRNFTHQLVDVYEELSVSEPGKFQVIFVSSDSNQGEFDQNISSLPWPSIPYKDKTLKNLSRIFLVNRIPAVVLIGPDGKTLNTNGRDLITSYGAKAFPFTETRITELEGLLEKEREGLPQQVSDPKHQHELKLDRAMAYVCDGCTRPGRFWVFSCNNCNFDLHPQCVQGSS
ncbi:probable nucleoredoxin 3 [Aristolochia californica]|uniref:probable nucleoredoxin 3 n=1 Tax=Aristolochia californica TaxID=171875 RepID=UPI0035DE9A43